MIHHQGRSHQARAGTGGQMGAMAVLLGLWVMVTFGMAASQSPPITPDPR